MVLRECVRDCLSRKLVWAMDEDEDETLDFADEGSDEDNSDAGLKFDVSGFALSLAGLSPVKAPKKRAKVVTKAFDWTRAARGTVQHLHMVDHVWSLLGR